MNGFTLSHSRPRPAPWRARCGRHRVASLAISIVVGYVAQPAFAQARPDDPPQPTTPESAVPGLANVLNNLMRGGAQQGPDTPADTPAPAVPAPGQISVTDTGLLDLHVRDLDIATVLEMLSYEARANIVSSTSVAGRVSANLYGVTLDEALEAILTPNNFAFARTASTVFVGRPEDLATLLPPPVTRVFRLKYVRPKEAAEAARSILGADANIVQGGTDEQSASSKSGQAAEMGTVGIDYLIVTAQPAEIAQVEHLLAQIDQRPQQVLVEATVLRATLNETNELGIDFTFLGGVDFQDVGSTSAASANLATGALPAADLQSTTFNVNTDFAGNVGDGGFTFGIIKDNIAAFVRALETVTDVTVVANPKIVALNKQSGEVIVGRRDGYLTTTVTETAAVQTVEFLETGTQIRFRPVINDDGSVRLSVHPKDSNGGLTDAQLPFEETTEAQADILINDGETVLIGGLFRERTTNSRTQLPLLGDLPWAGALFGSTSSQTLREEVIILLTVHIIKETEEERAQNRELLEDIERVRVGSRRGLMATGRERLAQAHYRAALAQLDEGDTARALLNARMALHNQPQHLSAIKLVERLNTQRLWDDEGTRMHTFVQELIDLETPDRHTPPLGRPEPLLNADGDAES